MPPRAGVVVRGCIDPFSGYARFDPLAKVRTPTQPPELRMLADALGYQRLPSTCFAIQNVIAGYKSP